MLELGFSLERDDILGREDRARFFKISGLPEGLIDDWSKRRAQVQAAKAEWLTDGATAARFSRKNKGEISREALFREWGMQAVTHGIDRDGVEQLRLEVPIGMEASAVPVLLDRLIFNDSTFRRSDLVTILLEGVTGGAQAIERAAALLTHEDVIQLSDRLFTTRQMLQLEAAMVNRAVQLVGQAHEAAHGVDSAQFTHQVELIGLDKKLSEQQMQALRHVTANSQFAVIQGHAGAGKSYLMGAAREAWQARGLDVLGVALSNAAAKNLNQEAGIQSTSVHAFLSRLEAGRVCLSADTVLVVDEAGMVGTRQMARLLEAVNAAGAKMVLVGDSQQLQPIEAGGAMAGIMRQTGFLELTEVRRQSAEVDRRIASDLRRGRTGPALETLRKLNRLHLASDSKAVRREAVAAYLRDREAGHSVLLLAAKNAEVSSLNVGVHLSLQQSGEVAAEGVIVKVRQGYREFATGGRSGHPLCVPTSLLSMTATPQNISVLGVGLMGFPIGKRLCEAGHKLTVWNRSVEKAERLLAFGAHVATTPGDAAVAADLVICLLENGEAVEDVLFHQGAAKAMRPGTLVVDMSSIRPAQAREHAERLFALGVHHVDAPVSGGTVGAEAGSLAIMAGGDAAQLSRARPALETLGRLTHVGPHGSGQLAKLANQMIVGITIGAVAEALLLCEKGGADMGKVREAIGGGFAESRVLQLHGQRMIERDFAKRAAISVQLKDMRNALATADLMGFNAPITTLLEQLFAQAADHGDADLDHSALFKELARCNGMD